MFYGVRVAAAVPIVASMKHWDRDLGSGFATIGIPTGTMVPLSLLLVPQAFERLAGE